MQEELNIEEDTELEEEFEDELEDNDNYGFFPLDSDWLPTEEDFREALGFW